ncbi:Ig-like protein group 4 [Microbacterium sp. AG790]|uniref:immunoglobulin-like domain-containing protein n=1 Tax=Microbacterium sp. AG790 TaxID=2183995 RepID=UPI000EB4BB66|nr:immunoglobulin-like domain-containing protein [Microbacterium sp. AG790]RKS93110.1 Ig-like protein group 4 [Microbacterium sp. AG790]
MTTPQRARSRWRQPQHLQPLSPTRARIGALAVAVGLTLASTAVPVAARADGQPSPVIHYSFDTASGTTISDVSGNGNDATLRQSGGEVADGMLSLPGGSRDTGAYLDIPTTALVGKKDLTISTWLSPKTGAANTAAAFIGTPLTGGASFSSGYWLLNPTNPAGYVKSVVTNATDAGAPWTTEVGAGATAAATTGLRTPAGLSLYTTVIDGTNGQLRVYVNGTRITQNAISRSVASFGDALTATLGRSTYNDANWSGLIDDFAVYGQAMSDADVQSLYNGQALDRAVAGVAVPATATADFALPTTSAGVAVSWRSDAAAIVVSGGTAAVSRPAGGSGDAHVTLTATFTAGTATREKAYSVTVPQQLTDQQRVSQDIAAVSLSNLDDVRTNFSVPATGAQGSTITWTVIAGTNMATVRDGVRPDSRTVAVSRPAASAAAATVELTAVARSGDASATRTFTARVQPMPGGSAMTEAYFWTFFTGEGQGAERVSIAASKGNDALSWNTLNNGQPLFSSTVGTQGLRDPFILRSPDGDKFYMIATDLKVDGLAGGFTTAQISGSRYIEVWESTDLVTWSDQRHVKVSSDYAGNTWAPEAFWDDELDTFVVYWASNLYPTTDPADRTAVTYNRMMYATTDDFVTFSEAKPWIDVRRGAGLGAIDSTVAKVGDVYYRFTKDEASMTIREEKSTNLLSTVSGSLPGTTGADDQWTLVQDRVASGLPNGEPGGTYSSGEGPNIFPANEGDVNGQRWFLFIDQPNYHGGPNHYVPFGTTGLEGAAWQPLGEKLRQGLPQNADGGKPRHGTVLPITRAEYQRVLTAYAPEIAVASVAAIDLSTTVGTAPTLPQATLTTVSGQQRTVDVAWDTVAPASYAQPGTFTVRGVAQDDSRMPVEATVTVTSVVQVTVSTTSRCVAGAVVLVVTAANEDGAPATVSVTTPYGARTIALAPGTTASSAFSTRLGSMPAGNVSAAVTREGSNSTLEVGYAAQRCR